MVIGQRQIGYPRPCFLGTELIGQSEYVTDRGVITHNLIRCFTSKIQINY